MAISLHARESLLCSDGVDSLVEYQVQERCESIAELIIRQEVTGSSMCMLYLQTNGDSMLCLTCPNRESCWSEI